MGSVTRPENAPDRGLRLEQLVERVVRRVNRRALVLAGGKAWCTKQTLEYMRFIRNGLKNSFDFFR